MTRKREPSSVAAKLPVLGRALFPGTALLALGLLSAVVESHAGVLAGPVTNPSNEHLYFLLTSNTWTASEAEAQSLGGHLVTINDSEEQDWVFESFGTFGATAKVLWIGLTDRDHEGIFAWLSGETCEFTNWEEGQPDDARGAEDYVGIWPPGPRHPGFWNDWPDDTWTGSGWAGVEFTASMHGVVEIVPDAWTGPGRAGVLAPARPPATGTAAGNGGGWRAQALAFAIRLPPYLRQWDVVVHWQEVKMRTALARRTLLLTRRCHGRSLRNSAAAGASGGHGCHHDDNCARPYAAPRPGPRCGARRARVRQRPARLLLTQGGRARTAKAVVLK